MARKANYEEKIATLQAKITKKQEELKTLKAQLEEVKAKKAQQDYKLKLRTPETLMRQGFIRFSDIRQHHIMHTVSGTFPIDPAVLP